MAIYKSNIVNINLEAGSIFRSFLNNSIGYKDDDADRFGVRVFRDSEPVDLSGLSCQAVFMAPNGVNIALTSYGYVSGNEAYVTLPPACYDYEGQFCLAIKLVGGGVTSTVRIVDGMVENTGASGTVTPTSAVPTYQEILATYDAMVAATSAANLAIAEEFDATKAYPSGKFLINDGNLYRLTADHAAGTTWANTSKVSTNFGDELQGLKSAFKNTNTVINVKKYGASGSDQSTIGNLVSGSNEVLLLDIKDFKVGDGVLISGGGAPCKEVLALVFENAPTSTGNIELYLPNESSSLLYAQAKKETVTAVLSGTVTRDGFVSVIVDGIDYEIQVDNGDDAETVASKIRGYYFEGWGEYDAEAKTHTNGGSGNTVILEANAAGNRRRTLFYDNGVGITFTVTYDKGNLTTPQALCNTLRNRTFTNWVACGYTNSNVVFFVAKTTGTSYKEGVKASVYSANVGIKSRMDYAQYGDYLVSEITAIDGNKITVSDSFTNTITAAYIGHDDTEAIKDCVELAQGKQLYFPDGTYMLSDELVPYANTSLVGESHNSTLKFQCVGINGIVFNANADNCDVQNLSIVNICSPDAYFGEDIETRGVWINAAKNTKVENCIFDNCDDAAVADNYGENNAIVGNFIKNTSEGSGIELLKTKHSIVYKNVLMYSAQHGVRVCGVIDGKVSHNTLHFNDDGISVQGFSDRVTVLQKSQGFIISENHILDCVTDGIVVFNQAINGMIKNNYVDKLLNDTEHNGINIKFNGLVNYVRDIVFDGNTIKGYPRIIYIDGKCRNLQFIRNILYPWRDGETSDFAVNMNNYTNGGITNVIFKDNYIVSECLNKYGIRLFTGSADTLINVHSNTFVMRMSPSENIQNHAIYNVSVGSYPNILKSKYGDVDTNIYIMR